MGYEESGNEELMARMDALRQNMSGAAAKRAVAAGGKVIRVAMQENTPVLVEQQAGSNALPPGTVKRMTRVRFPAKEQILETTALIGPVVEAARVAHLVEYGHRMVTGGESKLEADGTFSGDGKVHEQDVPAHPFLRPAYEQSIGPALDAMAGEIRDELGHAGS